MDTSESNNMNFYVVLPSNACPNTQPDNNASSYFIDVDNPLVVKGKWEVALVEYAFNYFNLMVDDPLSITYAKPTDYYKHYYVKFSQGIFNMLYIKKLGVDLYNDEHASFVYVKGRKKFYITILKYRKGTLVFNSLEDAKKLGFSKLVYEITGAGLKSETEVDIYTSFDVTITIDFENALQTNSKYLSSYRLFRKADELKEYFAKNLDGIIVNVQVDKEGLFNFDLDGEKSAEVTMDPLMAQKLGFEKVNNFKIDFKRDENGKGKYTKKTFKGTKKVKLMKAFEQLLIYTSISNPILVGNTMVPLLGTVWVDTRSSDEDIIHDSIDHPKYIPISTQSINNIEVQIRNDAGKLIQFPYGAKTILTLHFRKI